MSQALLRVGASLSGLEKGVIVKNGRQAYESFCHIYFKKKLCGDCGVENSISTSLHLLFLFLRLRVYGIFKNKTTEV